MNTPRLLLALSLALSVAACGGNDTTPTPSTDAGPVTTPDAYRPPVDAGPPVCVGTATTCSERSADTCGHGCSARYCFGDVRPCSREYTSSECNAREGCYWSRGEYYDECEGSPYHCSTYRTSAACRAEGCSWYPEEPCSGSPAPCTSLSESQCGTIPGCILASELDAGPTDAGPTDGGTTDAGVSDAGPWCAAEGECDPFAAEPCGVGRVCIADRTIGTRCVMKNGPPLAEGSTCTLEAQCAGGLDCIDLADGAGFRCMQQCPAGSTARCGARSACTATGLDAGGCIDYCIDLGPACSLYDQDCGAGAGCYPYPDPESGAPSSVCFPAGATTVGSGCLYADDCVPGAACIGAICRELCETTADCASGTCSGATSPAPAVTYCL